MNYYIDIIKHGLAGQADNIRIECELSKQSEHRQSDYSHVYCAAQCKVDVDQLHNANTNTDTDTDTDIDTNTDTDTIH